jgi:hypothetical protein
MIKVPTHIQGFVREMEEEGVYTVVSSAGNDHLELWYYGQELRVESYGKLLVATEDAPALIVAVDPTTKEQILLFDGAKHGYDNMFCNAHEGENLKDRALQRYDIPPSVILFQPCYDIDYEDEKDDYETTDEGNVILADGSTMPWDDVVLNGIDWITISYIDVDGNTVEVVSEELA